jgi:hypothetical protein
MKRLVLTIALFGSLSVVAPAMAQAMTTMHSGPGWSLEKREQWMADLIDYAGIDHLASDAEIQQGRQLLGAIRADHQRLLREDGGALKAQDAAALARRIDGLNRQLPLHGKNPSAPWPTGS